MILLVEDNPRNMKLMRVMLRTQGHAIVEAADGEAAVALLADGLPDLVVLDIQLPGISGLDVARHLRSCEATRVTPILAVTAFAQNTDRDAALGAGCTAYMTKPVQMQPFLEQVRQLLASAAQAAA